MHRSLGAFWHDLAHGVLHFEGKVWRTLPPLVLRPGELTRRYIEGERARFLSPVALFLFSVFLMFAVFSVVGAGGDGGLRNTRGEVGAALRHAKADLAQLEQLQAGSNGAGSLVQIGSGPGDLAPLGERLAAARKAVTLLEEAERSVAVARGYGPRAQLRPELKGLEKGLNKLYENPALALYKLQTSAYKYSWALIPLSVPLMWLLFPFSRRFRLYDHTVFVTYSLCFMTLLALLLSLLMGMGVSWIVVAAAAAIIAPVHMFRQLRGAYSLGRFGALWRALLLMLFASIATAAFGFLLLLLGALG